MVEKKMINYSPSRELSKTLVSYAE